MPNITNITPPRVSLLDPRTGLISRDWYRFFLDLFTLVGSGSNDTSISDLLVGPPVVNDVIGELGIVYDQAQIASMMAQYDDCCSQLAAQVETTPVQPTLEPQIAALQNELAIQPPQLPVDGVYVKRSGDEMTGMLTLPASRTDMVPLHLKQGVTPTTPVDGDVWFDQNGMYIQNLSAIHQLDADANAVGALSNAVITLGDTTGTINVSSIEVFIYASAGWQGNYMRRTVPATTGLVLTDGIQNYLTVIYNNGAPIYDITTTASLVNNSNRLLVATMWRTGADIHWAAVNWGLATATRLNDRLINIQRYVRSSGLMLGESAGNVITSTSGLIWYGIKAYAQGSQTSASSNCSFYYHSGGNWTSSTVSTYNNTQYDNGTNLVSLGPSKFTVNWIYQFVNGDGLPKLAYYMGSASYSTVAAAAGADQPTPPPILTQMAILLGRIIVGTGAATASEIDSAFTSVFAGTAITDHNSLAGLQGGTTAQYYHLTSDKYSQITGAPVTKTADFSLASTEAWVINNKSGSTCTVTLPAASSWSGRTVTFQNHQAQTLVSASSNVVPLGGGSAGTAILDAVAGNWCTIVSDGSNWIIMQAAPNNILLLD